MESKRCSKCGDTKPISMFHKNRTRADGLHNVCKECAKQYYATHRKQIQEQQKEYYASHREDKLEYNKQYRATHKKEMQQYMKQYYASPKGKMLRAITDAKRRGLGFELLYPLPMEYFRYPHNFCFHHVDDTHVVCIPTRLHRIAAFKKHNHRQYLDPFVKVFYFDYIYPDIKI